MGIYSNSLANPVRAAWRVNCDNYGLKKGEVTLQKLSLASLIEGYEGNMKDKDNERSEMVA